MTQENTDIHSATDKEVAPIAKEPDSLTYLTWDKDGTGRAAAMSSFTKGLDGANHDMIASAGTASNNNTYYTDPFTRSGYNGFRPAERTAANIKGMFVQADDAYYDEGLIRTVIDLMTDFTVQGIRIVHKNPAHQKFYQAWFKKVAGYDRSERFVNYLYRYANVIVKSFSADIKGVKRRQQLHRSLGSDETPTYTLPVKYTFINPRIVEPVGGAFSSFMTNPRYIISLSNGMYGQIMSSQNEEILSGLPEDIRMSLQKGGQIELDPDSTFVYYYKKDDWSAWAYPMLSAIMQEIIMLKKLRLADTAALDGAISQLRIIKIGSLEHRIAPDARASALLGEMLEANVGGGVKNIIWGPDIDIIETSTDISKFLGQEKYEPTLKAIYDGLGIPQTLTGGGGAGTTNNFISMRTMLERLEYGRQQVTSFWNEQIRIVQKEMGFSDPATIEFDVMSFGDEVAEKNLLLQMSDRNLVTDEIVQRKFGHNPDMELVRHSREENQRLSGKRPPKSNPYNTPQTGDSLKTLALQAGLITAEEAGLSHKARRKNYRLHGKPSSSPIVNPSTIEPTTTPPSPEMEMKGQPHQGRPQNSQDTEPRKRREFSPRMKGEWAQYAQNQINNVLNPSILALYDKKDFRSCTRDERNTSNLLKLAVLCQAELNQDITQAFITEASQNIDFHNAIVAEYAEWVEQSGLSLDQKTLHRKFYIEKLHENI